MKKIIILAFTLLISVSQAFAMYSDNEKKVFYDSFTSSFFSSLKDSLISQGISEEKVQNYIVELENNFNRTELENETWPCVNSVPTSQINMVGVMCFEKWTSNYIQKNIDVFDKLK